MRISDWSSDVCSSDLDRYIKGECPKCGTPDQYGDNCENCGAAYAPTDLKHPKSVVSGATPVLKDSEHFFFELPKFQGFLERSEEHTSELQSLMRISYAVLCLKKKRNIKTHTQY